MYPNYGDWLLKSLPARWFQAANRQGSGRRRKRARLRNDGLWRGGDQRAAKNVISAI
jgi:hypothetical protein